MASITLNLAQTLNYELERGNPEKELLLLLHGFQQSGSTIMARLHNLKGEYATALAPDGLFPVPHRSHGKLHWGFAWYFFDPDTDIYYREMNESVVYLQTLLEKLKLNHLPKTVVGYSMGGYLAPFVGLGLEAVKQVIGINCRFRSEILKERLPFRIDAVHGAEDHLVDPSRARECFEDLKVHGNEGEFHLIRNCGHGINRQMLDTLAEMRL